MKLEIVSGSALALATEVADVYVPAVLGEAGILSRHLPFVALLQAGEFSYLDGKRQRHYLFVTGGVIKVESDTVRLICDEFTLGESLALADLQKQLADVQQRIRSSFQGAISAVELAAELEKEKHLRVQLGIVRKLSRKTV